MDQMRRPFIAQSADRIVKRAAQHDEICAKRQGAQDVQATCHTAVKDDGCVWHGGSDGGQASD